MKRIRVVLFLIMLLGAAGLVSNNQTSYASKTTGKQYVKKVIKKIKKEFPNNSTYNKTVEYYDSDLDATVEVPPGCNGFVAYVTKKVFGHVYSDESNDGFKIVGKASTSSTKKMKSLFKKAKIGDPIMWYSKSGRKHMAIFLSMNSKGIKVYEANFGGKNKVKYNHQWNWKNMKTWPTGGASHVLFGHYKKYNSVGDQSTSKKSLRDSLDVKEKKALDQFINEQNKLGACLPTDVITGYNEKTQTWSGDVFFRWNNAGHLEEMYLDGEYAILRGNVSFSDFPFLKEIHITNFTEDTTDYITGIDVSSNNLLEVLEIRNDNEIEKIDVSNNTSLKELMIVSGHIRSIDITKNVLLEKVFLSYNCLEELDISNNNRLQWLKCDNNKLLSLDLSCSNNLRWLNCSGNGIKTLDCTYTKMEDLACDGSVRVIGYTHIDSEDDE